MSFSWVKKEICRNEFENHACKTPKVSRSVIINAKHNFWATILSSLDSLSEMIVSPAPVTQITYFDLNILINKGTSFVLFNLESFLCRCSLIPFVLIMLSLDAFLNLALLNKVLLDFCAKISIIKILIFFCFLVQSQVRERVTSWSLQLII
jgi:hypothetical protein